MLNWLLDLLHSPSAAQTILALSLTAFTGMLVGRLGVFGVRLGIAGVLFTGLLISALGIEPVHEVMQFTKEFGLILFVFAIGLEVGPGFFASLRADGLRHNVFAGVIVLGGVAVAVVEHFVFDIPVPAMVGILSGAVTNTPGLGAAQQVLSENAGDAAAAASVAAGMGYAVAYPFGIVGIILAIILIRVVYRISVPEEQKAYETDQSRGVTALQALNLCVTNRAAAGRKLSELTGLCGGPVVVSRLLRGETLTIPQPDEALREGDVVLAVGGEQELDRLKLMLGAEAEVDLRARPSHLASRRVLITRQSATRRSLREFDLLGRYQASITRITRAGIEFTPMANATLNIGDLVRVVGNQETIDEVVKELGNSPSALNRPNLMPVFMGIFLGVLLGSVSLTLPGLPAPVKLGLAGGPLVVAILMGWKGKLGRENFYMNPGANLILREVGIVLFLACVGLSAGGSLVELLASGEGLRWFLCGAAITFVPLAVVGLFARLRGMNYLTLAGLIAGSMTDPPALGFANALAASPAQATAYAGVYPMTMLLRVLTAQLFVLVLL